MLEMSKVFFRRRSVNEDVAKYVAKFLRLKHIGKDTVDFFGKKILVRVVVTNEPIKAGDHYTFTLELSGVVAVVFATFEEELGLFSVLGWLPINLIGDEVNDKDLWSLGILRDVVQLRKNKRYSLCRA